MTTKTIDAIRRRMAELGITQTILAEHIGATQQAVSRWLSGTVQPSSIVIDRMLDALNLEVRVRDDESRATPRT